MSSPVYLNPPASPFDHLGEQKDEQHLQLYLPSHLTVSSLSCPTFFNTTDQDKRMLKIEESKQHDHQQKVDQCMAYGASSDLLHEPLPNSVDDITKLCKREVIGEEGSTSSDNGSSSAKWMSSKMRLMQKMMNSNCTGTDESVKITQKLKFHRLHDTNEVINSFNNSNSTIRVCSDCNTTTTPLWRSGPRGPKSLCNACGIRQRKARRAMEAAAVNGTSAATDALATKFKLHNKEKKSRTSHVTQYKKQCNKPADHPTHHIQSQSERKICFKDFAIRWSKNSSLKQVFPQDVEEAAILLMELSCGFIQS